ncbi:MAG: winged helix-turn-helix transcriptional regulator [Patescibacteria group bacterium]|nr:winged helix-turn-helix transcriptional regulator [Patescibacteria group bacterium]
MTDMSKEQKVGIFSPEDDKTKRVGELLSADGSRNILKLLFSETLTTNQITEKTGISIQLVGYHLKKMKDLGLVEVSKVEKNSKGRDMKYYTATKCAIMIVPSSVSTKAKTSKSLLNSLKSIYRVASIVMAATVSWFITISTQHNALVTMHGNSYSAPSNVLFRELHDVSLPIIVTISVIIVGITLEIFLRRKNSFHISAK